MELDRTCSKCKETKALDLFQKDIISPNRKSPKRFFVCKQCRYLWYQKKNKKKNRVRYNNLEVERRIRYKAELVKLLGGKCLDCGNVYPTPVYDFHHLNPETKEKGIARLMQGGWDKVHAEVTTKCVLLCANCHRIRHFTNDKWEVPV